MRAHVALVIAAALASPAALSSQSVTVSTAGSAVRVQAPGFRFIDGESLTRLKDGQSVRVELVLAVLGKPGADLAAERRQTFVVSYDLWEERFAVTTVDASPRAMSHLSAAAAEAWCIQQLEIPVSALGPLARNLPFWIRLESRVLTGGVDRDDEAGLTLRSLIDALSRRGKTGEAPRSIEAGPFRVQE
jgi:hypothetical protein